MFANFRFCCCCNSRRSGFIHHFICIVFDYRVAAFYLCLCARDRRIAVSPSHKNQIDAVVHFSFTFINMLLTSLSWVSLLGAWAWCVLVYLCLCNVFNSRPGIPIYSEPATYTNHNGISFCQLLYLSNVQKPKANHMQKWWVDGEIIYNISLSLPIGCFLRIDI